MQIFLEFETHEALLSEYENNLSKARAFITGSWEVAERDLCELVLVHPVSGEWLPLPAEVVYIAPPESPAIGLEIREFTTKRAALVEYFARETSPPPPSSRSRAPESGPPSSRRVDAPPSSRTTLPRSQAPSGPTEPPPRNVQERVRSLNIRERDSMARGGTLTERVALERAYGAAVWDALLSNAALTGPEVARIAKNGNVTQPHLNIIVGNAAWLAKAEVRRALLTNPRLTEPHIERVLRALPPNELKKAPTQTAYSQKVRAVARRLVPRNFV